MKKLEEGIQEIKLYQENFRHPKLGEFKNRGLYDLYPERVTEQKVAESWPAQYTNCGDAGIYLFLNEDLEIVYIGKTKHFGARFGRYFSYIKGTKTCNLNDKWNTNPRFIVTVPVPQSSKFENLSLEGYLLSKIVTSDNTMDNLREE